MAVLLSVLGLLALSSPSVAIPHVSSMAAPSSTPTSVLSSPSGSGLPHTGILVGLPPSVKWVEGDGACNAQQQAIILEEMQYAIEAAQVASANMRPEYSDRFFPEEARNQPGFDKLQQIRLERTVQMLQGFSGAYPFGDNGQLRVLCSSDTHWCSKPSTMASIRDHEGTVNFCPLFFTDGKSTKQVLSDCQSRSMLLAEVKSRAMTIIHETTHTLWTGYTAGMSFDYAYGVIDCLRLAAGRHDRSCVSYGKDPNKPILCPVTVKEGDAEVTKEGLCDKNLAVTNADSFTFVVAGSYFSERCQKPVPIFMGASKRADDPQEAQVTSASCPADDNPEITDDGPLGYTVPGIQAFVHFGDSFASGMGAGETSGDSCRIGEHNYGRMLSLRINKPGLDFERRSCSGDTLDGLNNQIDAWSNYHTASFATLTMGGNDIGFSKMVKSCVITPFGSSAQNRKDCINAQNAALSYLQDQSDNGLRAKLKNAYLKIIQKSTVNGFQMFVTGYPIFFNSETDQCDGVTFNLWPLVGAKVKLTKALRRELNDLVAQLNGVILAAIQDADAALGDDRVHFVDVVGAFEAHRWCNSGIQEPDSSSKANYFLLSNWPDFATIDVASRVASSATWGDSDTSDFNITSIVSRDDAPNCDDLGPNPDPVAESTCWLQQAAAEDPNGPAAQILNGQDVDIGGNVLAVKFYLPTWLIQAFHPRSNGQFAYEYAVALAMRAVGFNI